MRLIDGVTAARLMRRHRSLELLLVLPDGSRSLIPQFLVPGTIKLLLVSDLEATADL